MKRRGDPDDFNPEEVRGRDGNGFDVGYGKMHVAANGFLGITGLVFVVTIVALLYVNYAGFKDLSAKLDQSNAGHAEMVKSEDLLGCVVSMTAQDRADLRFAVNRSDFRGKCPWLKP